MINYFVFFVFFNWFYTKQSRILLFCSSWVIFSYHILEKLNKFLFLFFKLKKKKSLRYYWKQGFSATAVAKKVFEVEFDKMLSNHVVFKKVNDGDINLKNKPRRQPTIVDFY